MVVKALKHVNIDEELARFNDGLVRDGGVYVSTRDVPLIIQTPTLTLASEMDEDADFATLKVSPSTLKFFQDVDAALVDLALAKKSSWFREGIAEDLVRSSLKSFVEETTVRVRVGDGVKAFDSLKNEVPPPQAGTRVKAVLELGRITFSKTQYGVVWTLKQLKLLEESKYLFEDEQTEGLVEDIGESILAADIE